MCLRVLAQALSFRAEHDRQALLPHRLRQRPWGMAGQADAPEARLADLVQRAREIDDAHPGHRLQRAGGRARDGAGLGWRVSVLRHQPERVEGRGRAHDRAQIVRIGHLVEDHERSRVVAALLEEVGAPQLLQRLHLRHQSPMRRVGRDQAAGVGHVGIDHRQHRRQLQRGQRLARAPELPHGALRVGERGGNRVPAPEARPLARTLRRAMPPPSHPRYSPAS